MTRYVEKLKGWDNLRSYLSVEVLDIFRYKVDGLCLILMNGSANLRKKIKVIY